MLLTQPEQASTSQPKRRWEASRLKRHARRMWHWISPFRVWRELRRGGAARRDFASGLAIGVFIACVPVWGLQTIIGLFAARKFSIHPLPIIAGTQLSAPPFAPALSVASIVLGHSVLTGRLPHLSDWHGVHLPAFTMAALNSLVLTWFVAWFIGGAILGLVLALLTYVVASIALRIMFPRPKPAAVAASQVR